jgi:uroporphyrinogen-III synthase
VWPSVGVVIVTASSVGRALVELVEPLGWRHQKLVALGKPTARTLEDDQLPSRTAVGQATKDSTASRTASGVGEEATACAGSSVGRALVELVEPLGWRHQKLVALGKPTARTLEELGHPAQHQAGTGS